MMEFNGHPQIPQEGKRAIEEEGPRKRRSVTETVKANLELSNTVLQMVKDLDNRLFSPPMVTSGMLAQTSGIVPESIDSSIEGDLNETNERLHRSLEKLEQIFQKL